MNDLSAKFMEKMLEYLNGTEVFLHKNVPAFVEEYLTYHFYSSVLGAVTALVFLVLFIWVAKKLISKWDDNDDFLQIIAATGLVCAISISFIAFASNFNEAVKIKVAPRVYLVDKFTETVKK